MLSERQQALDRFVKHVVSQSRKNLTTLKKNSSRNLYNSIKGTAKENPNSIEVGFTMEEYGFYQDKGVSGVKKKYDTPFSYRDKMPPPSKLDKWIVKKGIAPRNEQGKFISRKSLQFAIARSIFNNGIKPSMFFTKPFESAFKNLPDELVDAFGLDVNKKFDSIMNENFKK